jgi:hypothetical protein
MANIKLKDYYFSQSYLNRVYSVAITTNLSTYYPYQLIHWPVVYTLDNPLDFPKDSPIISSFCQDSKVPNLSSCQLLSVSIDFFKMALKVSCYIEGK